MSTRLSKGEKTIAFNRYARKHGFYVNTVRTITALRRAAIVEWLTFNNDPRVVLFTSSRKIES